MEPEAMSSQGAARAAATTRHPVLRGDELCIGLSRVPHRHGDGWLRAIVRGIIGALDDSRTRRPTRRPIQQTVAALPRIAWHQWRAGHR